MSLKMALTKGRLEKTTADLLESTGYGVENVRNKGRALVLPDTRKDISYVLVKSNDCITYVEHGVADLGVVGKDTLMEGSSDYYEMLDLKVGRCCFIVASLLAPACLSARITSASAPSIPMWPGRILPAGTWMWKSSKSTVP